MNLLDITVAYVASAFLFISMASLAALLRVWQ